MKKILKIGLFCFLFVFFVVSGGQRKLYAADLQLKVPESADAITDVGSVSYRYVTKSWGEWVAFFSAHGYTYSSCYYEVEVSGNDLHSKVSDICWCAFTKYHAVYWSPMLVNGGGKYSLYFNHWNYIGNSTKPSEPGGSYSGGAYWYFTNQEGVVYQDSWIHVPISDKNPQRLGYFYVDKSGHMLTGWNRDTVGNWYYFKIDHAANEDGASVKTGVSYDADKSTVCWKEIRAGNEASHSYGLYRYDGVTVRTNLYIMDLKGNYSADYQHSVLEHVPPERVPPLNSGSCVRYAASAAAAYYQASGFYHDTARGDCGSAKRVYLENRDWQSISIDAFQCYVGRSRYLQTIQYRKRQNGTLIAQDQDTKAFWVYYGNEVSLSGYRKSYNGYRQTVVRKDGTELSSDSYAVTNAHNIVFDYEPVRYTVRYMGNGADGGGMADSGYIYDQQGKLAANQYTKTYYKFIGWSRTPGGPVEYSDLAVVHNWSAKERSVITLYAQWERLHADYTLQIYRMNVTGNGYEQISSKKIRGNRGEDLILSELAAGYPAEGFTYAYGQVQGEKTERTILEAEQNGVIGLFFRRDRYVVELRRCADYGKGIARLSGEGTYYYGEQVQVQGEAAEGYEWIGWRGSSGWDSPYTELTFSMPAHPVIFEAQATPHHYRIVFDGNGATEGTMEDASISAVYDESYRLPENGFLRSTDNDESIFCGWSMDSGTRFDQVEYQEGQSVSNLTTGDQVTITLYAIWDDQPGIVAQNLYYTLQEAQDGRITQERLLAAASAYDREQRSGKNPEGELKRGYDEEAHTDFCVVDYAPQDFRCFEHGGSVSVTYQATDSGGNITRKQIRVFLADTTPETVDKRQWTLRFISERYLDTLAADSRWRNDPEYVHVLRQALRQPSS
ncbi:MAG: InlB B-repeat-containing protein [Lachnospiraceae bacterium]|nr:InlB B-repeat-containing protein [Lachnospiraceae bacterium]